MESLKILKCIKYIDHNGLLRKGAYNIIANIQLLKEEKINGFLVDWLDYGDFDTFVNIVYTILHSDEDVEWYRKFKAYPTEYGIFFTNYKNWIFNNWYKLFLKNTDEYRVSLLDIKKLQFLLSPPDIDPPEKTGNDYILYIEYKDKGAETFRWSSSLKNLKKQMKFFQKELGDKYKFSIKERGSEEDVVGETFLMHICSPRDKKSENYEAYKNYINAVCEDNTNINNEDRQKELYSLCL